MFQRKSMLAIVLLSFFSVPISQVAAADHLDAPDLRVPGQGGRDINDVYVFQSPNNPANSVLVVTVNPFAGRVNPFGTKSERTFDTDVDYEFLIDNNGDAVADVTYATTFTAPVAGVQTVTTTRNGALVATGSTGVDIPVSGGGLVHAALFDDPFFFDLVGFNSGFNFTGNDTFANHDTSAIVLEVPSTQLQDGANTNIGVWSRTLVGGNQVDRKGRPAINTALIPSNMKTAFNAGAPADDVANFSDEATAAITSLSDAANAAALVPILLPDILAFDTSDAGGFLNGRGLADDVIDAELNLLSAGAVMSDGVDANDVAFLGAFPYLAAPHLIPEPSAIALAAMALAALACGGLRRLRRA